MKNCFFIVALLFSLVCSCGKPDKNYPGTNSGKVIIKEYYSTGVLKTEISTVEGLRQGLTKNYDQHGRLISEVNYIDNMREGIARNFYAKSGKLNSSLEYKNGIKEGNEIWYYESGKEYRITPYIQGVISGIQKVYYENGNLIAEIPYKAGFPGTGLKEYNVNGTLISDYPKLLIQQKDYLTKANKVLLHITLSDGNEDVKFYKGPLTDGTYLNDDLLLLATQKGATQIDFNIPPGTELHQSVVLTAQYKTPKGNPYIISRTHSIQVNNKQ